MTGLDQFKGFHNSPEFIRLAVMLYARFPKFLRNVENLQHEHGIEVSHETIRYRWLCSARCLSPRPGNVGSRG